jgi:formylglycine-generating enzyme required for sulfatase activity
MKTLFSRPVPFLCVICLPVWAVTLQAPAQTSGELDIQLYAGLTITGAVGTVYSIEYSTDLTRTNAWRSLAFLELPVTNYLWTDNSAPANGQRFYRAVATAPTNLVFIESGTFRMGSPTNELGHFDDEIQHNVTLAKGFFMGKYLVTQQEYLAVTGSNPSDFNGIQDGTDYGIDLTRPVEEVTWNQAKNYCAKRTQQETAKGLIPTGSRYRLPTEAEWEYACRAGTSTRFYFGEDPSYADLASYAWYKDNSGGTTHPVGQKLPNPWGLYDMAGLLYEMCQDWYGPYPTGSVIDPLGPSTGASPVLRGGSWLRPGLECRSANRLGYDPPDGAIGFRVVLVPGAP